MKLTYTGVSAAALPEFVHRRLPGASHSADTQQAPAYRYFL